MDKRAYNFKDISNKTLGKFKVLEFIEYSKKKSWWKVQCLCGCDKEFTIHLQRLERIQDKGCMAFKAKTNNNGKFISHGLSSHPLYKIWDSMLYRCNNPKAKAYKRYGGRGIKVCKEWQDNIESFYDWAMNNKYEKGLHLDRIDNNGNYEPSNCRFVTRVKSQQNTRISKYWYILGIKYASLREASISLGISRSTARVWCEGKEKDGKLYPPKDGCFSEFKYKGRVKAWQR